MTQPASMLTHGPVLIIGTGLLGTSLALALRAGGVAVQLHDTSPTSLALARDMGAGDIRLAIGDTSLPDPSLVVVATPPDVAAQVVVDALRCFPTAVVTDVASVKERIITQVRADAAAAGERYVGSHPMAGRERSGAAAADSDLFMGRPWVLVSEGASPEAELAVRHLAVDVGATPVRMSATEHDAAVAAVSHVPQLMASLLAARLEDVPASALAVAGQGLRDTTRIAASDPRLWSAILVGNARPVVDLLMRVRDDLDRLIEGMTDIGLAGVEETLSSALLQESADMTRYALSSTTQPAIIPGAVGAITDVMRRGNAGHARIPGKHGGAPRRYLDVHVLVPDTAGSLGRLFSDVGAAGVNIEDFAMEHSAGQSAGIAILSVDPSAGATLEESLEAAGWRVVRL